MTYVGEADSTKDGIGDGMAEGVGVGVTVEAVFVRNGHAAEDEFAPVCEAVNVVADACASHIHFSVILRNQ